MKAIGAIRQMTIRAKRSAVSVMHMVLSASEPRRARDGKAHRSLSPNRLESSANAQRTNPVDPDREPLRLPARSARFV
ncbi:hypothetical protein [Polyangium spumosum]|uniref:Uncharacterized protein n=1 Tax=Polyangium spumosum TaxID=889282 RepID=A0A6N7PTR4_9BACT|nr:hypothetical protein [Polyangium spumosum]MRG95448.1 hypothetical protein [Polyangium spumosum]